MKEKEKSYDFLLGDIYTLPQIDGTEGILVRRLDFVCWCLSRERVIDLCTQWGESDRHYDYAICDGNPNELILFLREEDFSKFEFFTFLTPTTLNYRMVTPSDIEVFSLEL